jgi:cyclohexadieny/prephenate dehydrogenase / 3-phosphoshikimate 1-carboxyvinyltransferase
MSAGVAEHRVAVVVGLGLIGASLAAAMRSTRAADEVRGYDRDAATRSLALASGVVDAVADSLGDALAGAGLVVVAVPTLAVEEVLRAVRDHAPADALVTDVASVKGSVIAAAGRVFGALPPGFVPGHPIAGSERSGVGAANPELFRGHRVILTPHPSSSAEAVARVRELWEKAGARVVCMDAGEHDRVLALTSHLPHVLAFTLVNVLSKQDESEDIFRYAAGGFRDFTRIASSDPVMWRDIALANRTALLEAIDLYAAGLSGLRDAVMSGNAEALYSSFRAAREARGRYLERLAAPAAMPGEGA